MEVVGGGRREEGRKVTRKQNLHQRGEEKTALDHIWRVYACLHVL